VGITGTVFLWGWSEDDAFVEARAPVSDSIGTYSLDVISNTTWHLGAVYETASQYWLAREEVVLGAGGATRDLVLTGPHPKPAPVAVTFDGSQPQRILLADGTHVYVPAGAMPVDGLVTLHVVPIATLPHQRHANIYRYGYAFTSNTGRRFPQIKKIGVDQRGSASPLSHLASFGRCQSFVGRPAPSPAAGAVHAKPRQVAASEDEQITPPVPICARTRSAGARRSRSRPCRARMGCPWPPPPSPPCRRAPTRGRRRNA
jgi:hypothetical protein